MRIGILSDSHGQHLPVRQAMRLFDRCGVEHIVHCGDVGGMNVFDELVGRPVSFVWGNTDQCDAGLLAYLRGVGLPVPGEPPLLLTLGGKRLAVFHGHEHGFAMAARTLRVDYILHGHTHACCDERRKGLRIINPGALHRAKRHTVAVLDVLADQLDFHEIRAASNGDSSRSGGAMI